MREETFWCKKPRYSEVRVIARRVIARYDYCSSSHVDIPNLPSETEKVWTITFTRTSDVVTLVLHCNEVEVFKVVISDSICKSDYAATHWSRKPASKILFLSDASNIDTASDYYRQGKY